MSGAAVQLLCGEGELDRVCYACADPAILNNEKVLQNLLLTEDKYIPSGSYFKCVQKEIKPHMRKMVAQWMGEVCEEQSCNEKVFPLAINLMDRFLSVVPLRISQLQLLGTVCLFLSSKLRGSRPLIAEDLIIYTDHSITMDELRSWELLVLSRLKWDMAAVTAMDFLEHIMKRLPFIPPDSLEVLNRHATCLINLCAKEYNFSMYPPSMTTAGSIAAAAYEHFCGHSTGVPVYTKILNSLRDLTSIEMDCLQSCLEQIRILVNNQVDSNVDKVNAPHPSDKLAKCQSETPTDVQDIQF